MEIDSTRLYVTNNTTYLDITIAQRSTSTFLNASSSGFISHLPQWSCLETCLSTIAFQPRMYYWRVVYGRVEQRMVRDEVIGQYRIADAVQ
jgi:hypothetical protein